VIHVPVYSDDGEYDDDGGEGGESVSVRVDRVVCEAEDDAEDEEGLDHDGEP